MRHASTARPPALRRRGERRRRGRVAVDPPIRAPPSVACHRRRGCGHRRRGRLRVLGGAPERADRPRHPQHDLLIPLLSSPRARVMQALDTLVSVCLPPHPPGIFSFARYLNYLLQPRREMHADSIPIVPPDLMDVDYDQPYFTLDALQQGEKLLTSLEKPERLSHVLQEAQMRGEPIVVLEALVFLSLEYFDSQDTQKPEENPVHVLRIDDQQFWLNNFAGDDVLLVPREEKDAS